jgi:hypothetical protein
MKTHNRILFHCLACGRVVHAEPEESRPECCGRPMINAAAETVGSGDDALEKETEGACTGEAPEPPVRRISR